MGAESGQQIDAIIFDLDGVLVATHELHVQAWSLLAEEEGIRFEPTTGERLRGLGRAQSLDAVLEASNHPYTPEHKHDLANRKNNLFQELARRLGPDGVLPGVLRLLDEIEERGVKAAVASSSRNARQVLRRVGLADRFGAIVDATDVGHPKPDPELFLLAAELLRVPPARCLVIEDGAAGVEAARRAGMVVVGIGLPGALADADCVARSLADETVDSLLSLMPAAS
jgi:beta-phosphoglucomutase